MAKVIGLSIEIDGLSDITKQVVGLEQELKQLNTELKNVEVGSDAYIDLRNQVAATKEQLSQAKKEQKDFVKSAEATKEAEGSYYALNQQLVDLKKQYKSLSAAERESAKGTELQSKIKALDTELKDIDGSIGQFQRNVGNYPKTFAIINRSLIRSIPGFEAFSDQLKDAEGNVNSLGKALIVGFVAFQGAKLIAGAIKSLDEFNEKMIETRNTVAEFSGAYGENLDEVTASTKALADTFSTDAKTISEAAQALAKQMGISFDDALSQLEGALVEGRGNATDYLNKIKEFPSAFEGASGSVTELAQRNQNLLDTNKELARSQVDIAKETQKLGDNFKAITNTAKNTLLVILLNLIEVFKPVFSAVMELGSALSDLGRSFLSVFTGGKQTVSFIDTFTAAIKLLLSPVKVVVNILTGLVNILKPLAPAIAVVVGGLVAYRATVIAATIAQKAFNAAAKANPLGLILGAATAAAGAIGAYATSSGNAADETERLAEAERKANEEADRRTKIYQDRVLAIEKAFQAEKFALETRNAEGLIAEEEYNKESLRINIDRINKLVALNNQQLAENQRLAAANIKVTEGENEAIKQANLNLQIELQNLQVEQRKIARKEREEAEANFRKLLELRKKFAEQEAKEERNRIALLADLNRRLIEEQIKNITDARTRELKEAQFTADERIKALEKQYDDLQLAAQEREKELAETFGKASAELAKVRADNEKLIAQVQQEQANIRAEIEKQLVTQLAEINESFRQEEIQKAQEQADRLREFRDEALNSELAFIENFGNQRELKNRETLNRLLIQEEDAKKREAAIRLAEEERILAEIENIRNKQQALTDQEEFLREQANLGIEIKQEEYDAVLNARQELNTRLSELELQQTEIIRREAEKQTEIRKSQFEKIAGFAQQAVDAIEQVINAVNERAEANVEKQLERSEERQSRLNEEIENATGLRKKFLEQRLRDELQTEAQLAKKQEEIQRRAAIFQKGIAITQSIIQGLLAVSTALATPPAPNFVAAGIAGGAAAVTTAAIAAKQFEDGGMIVGPSHSEGGVPFTVQGKAGFEAEGGEFIVNRRATSRFLPVLSAINKFAAGGAIGAPNVSGIGNTNLLRAMNERTAAISGQVLESKVYLVTDELKRDTAEGERIKKKVTLR